jgi:hypothetical protein
VVDRGFLASAVTRPSQGGTVWADWVGLGRRAEECYRMTRPSVASEGLGLLERKEEGKERESGQQCGSYTLRKRWQARARALPDAAAAVS